MKIEYDKDADAAYIYIAENIAVGEAVKTIELNDNIILDFNKNGKLLGIEVLDASKVLNKELLVSAGWFLKFYKIILVKVLNNKFY